MIRETPASQFRQHREEPFAGGEKLVPQTPRASWLICRAGVVVCALPIEHVLETMRVLPIKSVAGAPAYVLGLSIIRGAPVPVVDVGLIVGGTPTLANRLVTARMAERVVALALDEVIGIADFAADAFAELPPLLQDAAAETIAGIATRDSGLVFLLRTSRLVPDDVLAHFNTAGALS